MEIRSLATPPTLDPARPNRVRGYAAVFNSPSEILAERGRVFREVILPGAFQRSIASADVLALWQHGLDARPPLGRTAAQTLRLFEDAKGLAFELDLPDSAADVREAIARRDVWGMSFAMRNEKDRWSRRDGRDWREVSDLDLKEISVVIIPAYPATSVGFRDTSTIAIPEPGPDLTARARRLLELAERA